MFQQYQYRPAGSSPRVPESSWGVGWTVERESPWLAPEEAQP
jgi:hypothetical protein